MPTDYVLSVMALDRVGIVAGMTEAIVELGGNIEAISQTVLQGYFTIIVTVRFEVPVSGEQLAAAVGAKSGGELAVSVQQRQVVQPEPVVSEAQRFILTLSGADQKGVIHRISSYLASRGVNLEDLYAYREGERFVLIAQLQVPPGLEVERLQMDVEGLWPPDEMEVALQHENIFLATNQVDFRHGAL